MPSEPLTRPICRASTRGRIRREARLLLAIYAGFLVVTLFVSDFLFWAWLVPVALGFPFLRLYLLAEHGRCPAVANMFDQYADDLYQRAGSVPRLEHALPRGAPCPAAGAVPSPSPLQPAHPGMAEAHVAGICCLLS